MSLLTTVLHLQAGRIHRESELHEAGGRAERCQAFSRGVSVRQPRPVQLRGQQRRALPGSVAENEFFGRDYQ